MEKIKQLTKNPITYKISVDTIILFVFALIAFLIAESIISGILSNHISTLNTFLLLFFLVGITSFLAHKQGIAIPFKNSSKLLFISFTLLFIILISIAGFRYGYFAGFITIIFSVSIFISLHSNFKDILKHH